MNRKLDKMRIDIQNRIKRNTGLLVCTMIFLCVAVTGVIPVQLDNEQASTFVSGFQLGLLCTLLVVLLANLVKYRNALKDNTLLKRLYYQENDERMIYINQQVGKATMSVMTVIMVIATIISGYFNFTVFCTMIAVTLLQALIQIGLKWYCTNCISAEDIDEE